MFSAINIVRFLTITSPIFLIVGYIGGICTTYFRSRKEGRKVIKKDLNDVFSRRVFTLFNVALLALLVIVSILFLKQVSDDKRVDFVILIAGVIVAILAFAGYILDIKSPGVLHKKPGFWLGLLGVIILIVLVFYYLVENQASDVLNRARLAMTVMLLIGLASKRPWNASIGDIWDGLCLIGLILLLVLVVVAVIIGFGVTW